MKRYENNRVLAFGDTHFPYGHKDTFKFLKQLRDEYTPDRVVHMGDIMDIYSLSSYPKDPNHPDSWDEEIRKGRENVAELAKLFPELEVLESNHDDRVYKRSKISNIPREFLVPYRDVIGAPSGWKWHRELNLTVDNTRDQLYFAHTKTGGAFNCARDLGKTVILGHHHTLFGAKSFRPSKNKVVWGVDAGCLISDKGSPFSYNKGTRGMPMRGCVMLVDGQPILERI